ncbi:MAG: cell division protease FtsH [Mariniblastus sp.]|jgi:cell division protease FtsH
MDNDKVDSNNADEKRMRGPTRNPNFLFLLLIIGALMLYLLMQWNSQQTSSISVKHFENLLQSKDYKGEPIVDDDGDTITTIIQRVEFTEAGAEGIFSVLPRPEPTYDTKGELVEPKEDTLQKNFTVVIPANDRTRDDLYQLAIKTVPSVVSKPKSDAAAWVYAALMMFTFGLVIFMILSLRRSQGNMMGGGGFLSNFSRSPAKKYEASAEPITFKDVAGLEGVKADLGEIVDFLKDPTKFQKLGGRVPKGALLIGPPGTGKTLLARAVAGEAGVPYFSVNGSEFIQMFVGVGASRVRDLFATAKAQSPAIIFIDEIDAVGRQRGAGLGGGHDEREQTLNQILGEMDGFQATESVIILAATNRPDILDPALLRPGRFDRHVTVSRPTKAGRLAIFKVHVRDVPLAADVDLDVMAQATAGMTGADIQNLVNESALWAARSEKNKVEMEDFYYAHDKVLMGAKREEVLTDKEKERTAYHEAGHTLAAWNLTGANPVHKVTIIPRGQALGVTQMVPDEDRLNMSEHEIFDHLVVLLSGRAAETLIYDELTVGAENDLERATSMARRMVTHWGMSKTLGPVSYKMSDEDPFLGGQMHKARQFSEHTMEVIDEEVHKILQAASASALELLKKHQDGLESVTQELIVREELDRHQIAEIIGPSVHKERESKLPDRPPVVNETPAEEATETSESEDS